MKILVCGGREYGEYKDGKKPSLVVAERAIFYMKMDDIIKGQGTNIEIISGMAKGADTLAVNWAKRHGHRLHEYPADWDWYGKGAGAIRNRQMLNEGKPDLVVAFPGGVGTYHMISIAKRAGVRVIEIEGPYRGEVSY